MRSALSSVQSSHPEWLQPAGGMQVLVQFARGTRHPAFPNAPTARELARTPAGRALIELAEIPYALSRPFAAPPDVPADRASALRSAFLQAHRDPQLLDAADRLKIEVSPIGGADVMSAVMQMATAPPELIDYMKRLLADKKS
jgi:tripartite-type tricarboxylate transporter receptor subunit TctC